MRKKSVLIVDYGVGNLFNVQRAFESLGATPLISRNPEQILNADRILLPGVGAFAAGMEGLRAHGLVEVLREVARRGTIPLLGICLGMQLLMDSSEENGDWQGLKLIPGHVRRFSKPEDGGQLFKIPQIGWNTIEFPQFGNGQKSWDGTLLQTTPAGSYLYFVHSYHVVPTATTDIVAETNYGRDRFCSVIRRGSVSGCQFHPERSGESGLSILRNFIEQDSYGNRTNI